MSKKQLSVCLLAIVLLVIALLVFFLREKEEGKKSEGFCTCSGMSEQSCPDPATLQYLYKAGMTENDIPPNGYSVKIVMPYDAAMPLLNSLPSQSSSCKQM